MADARFSMLNVVPSPSQSVVWRPNVPLLSFSVKSARSVVQLGMCAHCPFPEPLIFTTEFTEFTEGIGAQPETGVAESR
jgi:hypothetical protein